MLNSHRSWFWLTLLGLATLVACSPRSTTKDGDALAGSSGGLNGESHAVPPAQLLRTVLDHYRTASFYRDQASVLFEYDTPRGPIRQHTRLALAYLAPHSLRLVIQREANEFHLSSDGKQTWAWVRDSQSDNLRHQVVQRPAPSRWTVSELYAATELADPARPDQMLSLLMGLPLPLQYSPCGLVCGDSVWEALLADESQVTDETSLPADASVRLVNETRRVQVISREGRFVFWIDPLTQSIRRLELPTGRLFAHLAPEDRPRSMRLVIDWDEASWEPTAQTASLFTRTSQPDETLVRYFVLPPSDDQKSVSTDRLKSADAKRESEERPVVDPFPLEVTVQQTESSRDWQGHVSVLVWFQDHPSSHAVLPALQRVYEQLGGEQSQVIFRAVCSQAHDQLDVVRLNELVKRFGLTMPVRRDPLAAGRDQLNIREAPTTVVLDDKMRIQLFEVGANPGLGDLILETVRRLTRQDAPAVEGGKRGSNDEAEQQFQRQLQVARFESVDAEVPPAELQPLPAAREFAQWKQAAIWQTKDVVAPGNLWIDENSDGSGALLALDGSQALVELDGQGQVVNRHPLVPDESQPITQWEQARDGNGKAFYLGYTRLASFVEVFDASFQPLFRYPAKGAETDELVQDAELADLDHDGTLELYVAFDKNGGLHRVDLSGQLIWQQHGMSSVYSMSRRLNTEPQEPSRQLLALGEQGLLVPVGVDGQMERPLEVGARTFYSISTAAGATSDRAQYLGLSYTLEGRPIAIGLNGQMQEIWSYGLPAGVHRSQVRPPLWTPSPKSGSGIWWLAGADGSLHAIFDDGSQYDFVRMGEPLHGFGAVVRDGVLQLFVATPSTVRAIRITPP